VLGVEEATDLGALGFGDHEARTSRWGCAGASFDLGADEVGRGSMAARTVKQAIGVARRRRRGESMEWSLRSIGICGERMHWHRAASRNPGRLDVDR
jgi:hypothetical protein